MSSRRNTGNDATGNDASGNDTTGHDTIGNDATEHRADRPLTARSVLLSLLLGNEPPRAPVRTLVRTAELFGIADGTARTALSRMAASGELRTADGRYELASTGLRERHRRQTESRAARLAPWDGTTWWQAVITADGARPPAERAATRRALVAARLGELRDGVWLRPTNLARPSTPLGAVTWFRAVPEDDPVDLTHRLWDLDTWAARAETLTCDMDALQPRLERHDHSALADGFVTSAAVLRLFQSDPLVPPELVPPDWPGPDLRHRYDRYDAAYRDVLATWFRSEH